MSKLRTMCMKTWMQFTHTLPLPVIDGINVANGTKYFIMIFFDNWNVCIP